ncbi:MAG TPA: tetratricopeptide repeat protein [Polyangiaceae bacterium]|nr:tetratricopeptide repeat protein [Polyangiaceae bacterium]
MRLLAVAPVLLCLLVAEPASAQSVGDFAERGHVAMQAGRWGEALAAFDAALALSTTPPLLLHRGRCLEELGRLVEARDAYRAASEPVSEDAPAAFRHARERAIEALAALDQRLPVIAVELGPELRGRAALSLDGAAVAPATTRLVVDPGPHVVTAEAEGQRVRRAVTAREGQTHRLVLDESVGPSRVVYGGRLFWGATFGAASLGLTATFVYSTVRLDAIRSDPGYQAFAASVRGGDDACAAARTGTPGVDYLAAPGAHSRGEMVSACNDADTLQALQIVTVPTAIVTGALAGYLLAHVVEDVPPRVGVVPIIGSRQAGIILRAAF